MAASEISVATAGRRLLRAAIPLLIFVSTGCTRDPRVECSGTVTFAGEAVEEGSIGFFPLDGAGRSEGAVITAGRYRACVVPGRQRVEIRASRAMSDFKGPSDLGPPRVDFIPEEFNSRSTLTVDVTRDGPNEFTFDLTPSVRP